MRRELREKLRSYAVPSIMVTHDLRDVASIGDRACLMERGKIALEESGGCYELGFGPF